MTDQDDRGGDRDKPSKAPQAATVQLTKECLEFTSSSAYNPHSQAGRTRISLDECKFLVSNSS
jgi:hypothetical protein